MVVLDQFGLVFAKIFRPPTSAIQANFSLKDTGGVVRSVHVYGRFQNTDSIWYNRNSKAQVGKGLTPAVRSDFQIEDPFPDAPESVSQTTLNGGYNSPLGKISVATQITPTGGSGSITEVIKIQGWADITSAIRSFAIFRDNISPAVSFVNGETINLSHEVFI